MSRVALGDEAKCKISGFKGIATSLAVCLTGCDRVALRAPMTKEGKLGDEYWFDVDAVEVIRVGKVKPVSVRAADSPKRGGPPTKSTINER